MTINEFLDKMEDCPFEYAYHHINGDVKPPFVVWTSQTDNFEADNMVYLPNYNITLELYSRDTLEAEQTFEEFLTKNFLWEKTSMNWLDENKVCLSTYEIS